MVDMCHPGLILPAFDESKWSRLQRATLYFFGLLYTFLGITVIMDTFMTAVDSIISKKKKVYELRPDLPEWMQQRVWNDTVANLTVMAVGVSAPEILLSIVEIIGHGFQAAYIGPGTIVGSGAFNILVVAFCICSVGKGEIRRILHFKVFLVTGFFHLFSYIWLYLILQVISPGVIEIWEGMVTLFSFPVLVFIAFATSKHWWTKRFAILRGELRGDEARKEFAEATFRDSAGVNSESIAQFIKEVMKYPGVTVEDAAVLAAEKIVELERSPMWYRISGSRILTSGRPLKHRIMKRLDQVYGVLTQQIGITLERPSLDSHERFQGAEVEFESPLIAVTEARVDFPVYVRRFGDMSQNVAVRVTSLDGMAVQGEDFEPVNEVIVFEPGQSRAQIMVRIIDEQKYEPTEEFFLRLTAISQDAPVKIGKVHIMEIKIIHIKSPGEIEFERRGTVVKESEETVEVGLVRKGGSDGVVSVSWTTADVTAKAGEDYQEGLGEVVFDQGVIRKSITIGIINTRSEDKDVKFKVILTNPTGGALIGRIRKITIIITDDDDFFDVDNFIFMTNINMDKLVIFRSNWCKQIREAMLPNGGDLESATNLDYFLHFLFFLWKVLFSLIPPPSLFNGWLTFFIAICVVALVVTLTGDLASIFGCTVGLHDTFTAMTFMGIGTSLTDAFACRFALLQGKSADVAIGNINGTAAINVYLGFGLPWTMAAIYNALQGKQFLIPVSGGLGSVILGYTLAVSMTLSFLFVRRNSKFFGEAEIGGPPIGRCISTMYLVSIWVVYITVCYLHIQGYIVLI